MSLLSPIVAIAAIIASVFISRNAVKLKTNHDYLFFKFTALNDFYQKNLDVLRPDRKTSLDISDKNYNPRRSSIQHRKAAQALIKDLLLIRPLLDKGFVGKLEGFKVVLCRVDNDWNRRSTIYPKNREDILKSYPDLFDDTESVAVVGREDTCTYPLDVVVHAKKEMLISRKIISIICAYIEKEMGEIRNQLEDKYSQRSIIKKIISVVKRK